MFTIAVVVLVGYLIGSVPAGYLAGCIAGIDIRKVGSGNIGATNVLRILGKRYGYPVFLFDFLKGVAAVEMSILIFDSYHPAASRELYGILGGVSSVIGHSYPVWLNFKGGKGVATTAGVVFALIPFAALVMCVVWVAAFQASRYVSVASIAAAIALPVTVGALLYFEQLNKPVLLYFSIWLAAVVIVRHRSNVSRLLNGTEPRFQRK
ncbi:MAG TPA: acyl-phosphate glycerol 3-phosphate acyltransferase [Spartobacteria bacterium]|nr:acyl-phosphate glycerol 3-phosphate acyltransferase [Spartobacteria bacterium]